MFIFIPVILAEGGGAIIPFCEHCAHAAINIAPLTGCESREHAAINVL